MPKPPASTELFKKEHAGIWKAFEELSKQCRESGSLDEKSRRLVKVALAIGAGVEGGAHSAVRHAKEAGISKAELRHVALLAITTLGFPSAMRGLSGSKISNSGRMTSRSWSLRTDMASTPPLTKNVRQDRLCRAQSLVPQTDLLVNGLT